MRGGRRENAGRKPGPEKVRLTATVLPETMKALNQRALYMKSLGAAIDDMVGMRPALASQIKKQKIS